jgi:transcriptional regulator with GAF, ATPase, and Fis domain
MSLIRLALWALGLVLVIPFLAVIYLLRHNMAESMWVLGFLLMVSGLGYYLLWSTLRSAERLAADVRKVSRGEAESLVAAQGLGQLPEAAETTDALNEIAKDLRENAAQLERFIRQFAALAEVAEITAKAPSIQDLLSLVLRKAMALTQARIGTVMLLHRDGDKLQIAATEAWEPKNPEPLPLDQSLGKRVIETGLPMVIENIERSPLTRRKNNADRYDTASFLIMPLKSQEGAVGLVSLADKATGGVFNADDQQFLALMLGQVGQAVRNSRLLAEARDAAALLRKTVEERPAAGAT